MPTTAAVARARPAVQTDPRRADARGVRRRAAAQPVSSRHVGGRVQTRTPSRPSRVAAAAAAAAAPPATTDRDVVLITGAAKGIGAACATLLASQGWSVAINHRASSKPDADALVASILASGGHAAAFEADVSQEPDVCAMFEAVRAWGALRGLVNNAGILRGPDGSASVADLNVADVEAIVATNVIGPMLCTREAMKLMSAKLNDDGRARGGSIVNISSGSAVIGRPLLYAASKGALNSFQAGAVDELASHGIRINAVSPGMTNTDLVADVVPTFDFSKIPLGRIGEPEEIAAGVAFLLNETGSYCSGANIRMSGGRPPGTFLG